MNARAKIFFETRQADFLRLASSTDGRPAFQNQHFKTCLGQIRGADQAIVPGAGNHKIETLRWRCGLARARWLRYAGLHGGERQ